MNSFYKKTVLLTMVFVGIGLVFSQVLAASWDFAGGNIVASQDTGGVGVGVAVPTDRMKLDVGGGFRINGHMVTNAANGAFVFNAGPTTDPSNGFWFRSNTRLGCPWTDCASPAFTTLMRITSGGRVGIGVTDPQEKLVVAGTIHSTTGGIKFPDGTVQTTAAGTGSNGGVGFDPSTANTLPKWSATFGRLTNSRVSDNGTKVTVTGPLEVTGVITAGSGKDASCANGQVLAGQTVSKGFVTGGNCVSFVTSTTADSLWRSSQGQLYADPTFVTNVGIGRLNPQKTLDVNGSIRLSSHLIANHPSGAMVFNAGPSELGSAAGFWFRANNEPGDESTASGFRHLMRITSDGKVGIGQNLTSPQAPLEVESQGNTAVRLKGSVGSVDLFPATTNSPSGNGDALCGAAAVCLASFSTGGAPLSCSTAGATRALCAKAGN